MNNATSPMPTKQTQNKEKKIKRPVNGILLLDKPSGITSNGALQRVKHLFHAKKAGHTGSLDPLATGMLPICFGESTKFSQYLLEADKTYIVTAKLGQRTTTSDAEGDIVSEREVPELSEALLNKALEKYRGDIDQVPSMFSALKHNGQPLYKLARQGITVERKSRRIHIFENTLLGFERDLIQLKIHASKGTYVRTIIDDLGEDLGCGAHVVILRRTQVAKYPVDQMVTIEELEAQYDAQNISKLDHLLLPTFTAVDHWPQVTMTPVMVSYMRQGQAVQVPGAPAKGWMRLADKSGIMFGIGEIQDDGLVAPRRLIRSSTQT
jgi:tRNA pseudouridine55 synthase